MSLSLIVAVSDNGVIGHEDRLPWRLSSDLKRFKSLTMGHHIIMGRKTYDSIQRLLPGRTTIILSRQPSFAVDGAKVALSIVEAIQMAGDDSECFVIGGSEIYRQSLGLANRLYFTKVHAQIDGDTRFPYVDWSDWTLVEQTKVSADEKNEFDSTFCIYDRA